VREERSWLIEGKTQMPTLQESSALQQAENLCVQITTEQHLAAELADGLKDLELRENRVKQQLKLELTIWERRSATTQLEKLARKRASVEGQIARANRLAKVARDTIARVFPSPQCSMAMREVLRRIAT
jgi:hypothetical protein